MSTDPRVSAADLNDWLNRDRKKQRQAADRLFVSERTIDGWRNGRTIPDRYHAPLLKMIRGEDLVELRLPPAIYEKLAKKAEEKGYHSPDTYVSELLKGFLLVALLGATATGIPHPRASAGPSPAAWAD